MTATVKPPRYSADDLYAMLQSRCESPAWALLPQVGNATGWSGSRYADAVGMELFPSRGLALHGYEIKVSAADWKKELANPEKADAVGKFCNYWWIVAPKGLVPKGDLPTAWGLLEPARGSLRATKSAVHVEHPMPIDLSFLAALLRRVYEYAPPINVVADAVKAAKDGEFKRGVQVAEDTTKYDLQRLKVLENRVEKFEAASGVDIGAFWEAERIGEAVRMALHGDSPRQDLIRIRDIANRIAGDCTAELDNKGIG